MGDNARFRIVNAVRDSTGKVDPEGTVAATTVIDGKTVDVYKKVIYNEDLSCTPEEDIVQFAILDGEGVHTLTDVAALQKTGILAQAQRTAARAAATGGDE
ncbi:hypothetical protein HNP93_000996 [Methanococcus maripaludis]|uniref:Uncharacterized protein n=1 Tax=Methanococcus maripaludis TaxID=39152 RepID=A0A7J9P542_METMI|nr:hypothetical protein [Methanococcus maripaludis]MBA2858295.1 hypothetical protein [Methanococcus maripaludis]